MTLVAPPLRLYATEPFALAEYAAFVMATPVLQRAPRPAHPQPVLVLPGFGGSDSSTRPLRTYLSSLGYRTYGWQLGINWWRTPNLVNGVPRRICELAESTGQQISLVGWSAGGNWAREFTREHPAVIDRVITLASPFRFRTGDRSNASWLFDRVEPHHVPRTDEMNRPEQERPPLPVPCTSIYTRTDGIVHWEACVDTVSERAENIEVRGTHCGLGNNVAAAYAIADRLAQPNGEWAPFVPPSHLGRLYPRPADWRDGGAF